MIIYFRLYIVLYSTCALYILHSNGKSCIKAEGRTPMKFESLKKREKKEDFFSEEIIIFFD